MKTGNRVTAALVASLYISCSAHAESFEEPSELRASDVLTERLLSGNDFTVDPAVRSDGYLNQYVLRSTYGDFEITSTSLLAIRVREVEALATIDDVSKTEVFIQSAAEAGVGQIRAVTEFATHPVETVTGIPKGVVRMFKRYSRQAGEAVDATREFLADDEEAEGEGDNSDQESRSEKLTALTESYLGVSGAERAWAEQLGVDPYSSNEVLRKAIKEVAWADRLARFGMKFASIPEIPGADVIGEVNSVVWSKDPYELADLNRARLAATGADDALIDRYLTESFLSPTQQTYLTAAIAEMDAVSGRDGILRQALALETESQIGFFVKSVAMLAWYHINKQPLEKVLTDTVVPRGMTKEGDATLLLATDYAFWTEEAALTAANYAALRDVNKDMRIELWLLGGLSDRAAAELDELGIEVHTNLVELAD